jgi:hypothetical protein
VSKHSFKTKNSTLTNKNTPDLPNASGLNKIYSKNTIKREDTNPSGISESLEKYKNTKNLAIIAPQVDITPKLP